jgi:trehalose 6-phosphate phosphatase
MPSTDVLLAEPPLDLIRDASLFLDFDGTLAELVDDPGRVRADPELAALLGRLADVLPGRVAIVSGRSIEQLDRMLGDAAHGLALAGSHGAEFRAEGAPPAVAPSPALPAIRAEFEAFAASRPGVIVERKSLGAGLHYRQAPQHEAEATALAERLARAHGLHLQRGKMMAEVRSDGDKGRAVTALAASAAMAGTTPLVFGDDLTDEAGFRAAAQLGGAGVLVGEPRETAAAYALAHVAAVRRWLGQAAERLA